jgi:Zn-dependent peptidase ImmA (M78 family)
MNFKRFSYIENIAKNILTECDCFELPINVNKLVEKQGINLVEHEFGEDIYGVLVIKDGKYTIGFNKNNHPVRQRFTIAHELGHYILGHNKDGVNIDTLTRNYHSVQTVFFRNNDSSTGEYMQEREANAFAAALLMPQDLLVEKLEKCRFNFDMDILAKEFGVSTQAMAYRLSNLGLLDSVPF